MLSRVANSVYWMCRYVERAENVARFLGVNLNLLLDMPSLQGGLWEPMVQVTGDHQEFEKRYDRYNQENVIRFLAFDREYGTRYFECDGCSNRCETTACSPPVITSCVPFPAITRIRPASFPVNAAKRIMYVA